MTEIMASNHRFYVSDTCPFERYDTFAFVVLMSTIVAVAGGMLITMVIMTASPAPPGGFMGTYRVLEAILANTDPIERNEAFLDACIKYSKTPAGKNEAEFRSTVGMGRCEEVWNHYIKMEAKRLEAKDKDEVAKETEELEGKIVEEKPENMV